MTSDTSARFMNHLTVMNDTHDIFAILDTLAVFSGEVAARAGTNDMMLVVFKDLSAFAIRSPGPDGKAELAAIPSASIEELIDKLHEEGALRTELLDDTVTSAEVRKQVCAAVIKYLSNNMDKWHAGAARARAEAREHDEPDTA
jgi:hypothetical protein